MRLKLSLTLWKFITFVVGVVFRLFIRGRQAGRFRNAADWNKLYPQVIGSRTWIHSPSHGETKAMLLWFKTLSWGDRQFIFTVSRYEALEILQEAKALGELPASSLILLAPWDSSNIVRDFCSYFDIQTYIVYESDLWPNTIEVLIQLGVSIHWMNARFSPSNQSRLIKLWLNYISRFLTIIPRSHSDLNRLQRFSSQPLKLGFDSKLIPLAETSLSLVGGSKLLKRPLMILVSVHLEELASLRDVFLAYPRLQLVVFPRKLSESDSMISFFKSLKMDVQIKEDEQVSLEEASYLIKKMGLVSQWLKEAQSYEQNESFVGVYVGGGLRKKPELHNVFEPITLQLPTFCLGGTHPWEDEVSELKGLNLLSHEVNTCTWLKMRSNLSHLSYASVTNYRLELNSRLESAIKVWKDAIQ